jgi:hypothetical protein
MNFKCKLVSHDQTMLISKVDVKFGLILKIKL